LNTTSVAVAGERVVRRRMSVVLAGMAIFLMWAALFVYTPILPVYARNRGASLEFVGLITASYGLTQCLLRIPLGVVSDRIGRRKPFVMAGILVIGLSCLVLAWAPSPIWLLVGRGLAGVGISCWVAASVLFASYFPPDQTVRAASVATFLSAAAQMVVTALGGRLADMTNWLVPFYVGAATAGVGALALATVPDETVARRDPSTWQTLRRVSGRRLLLVASAIAAVGQWMQHTTTYTFVSVYASTALKASATELGALVTCTLAPFTVGTFTAAEVARRIGARRTLILGLVLAGVATAAVPLTPSFLALGIARAVYGLGYGLVYPVAMGLSIRGVPGEERGSAMGVFQALYAIGMVVGPATGGWLAAGVGLAGMFWLLGALSLATALAVIVLSRCAAGWVAAR